MSRSSTATTGLAGEYFVAAELSRMGHIAVLTLRNTEGVDILVSNADGTRSVSLQVKTQGRNGHQWPLGKKHESICRDSLFYVFVTLRKSGELPEYYIVPSKTMAKRIRENHEEWLAKTDRHGRKHKDNPMRLFVDYAKYQDRWELLGL